MAKPNPKPDVRLALSGTPASGRYAPLLKDEQCSPVRLAQSGGPGGRKGNPSLAPNLRLATSVADRPTAQKRAPFSKRSKEHEAFTVRLAHSHGAQGDNTLTGRKGVEVIPVASAPALLVSFVYLEPFIKNQSNYVYRDWALDSGAYSAWKSGTKIDLQEYIDRAASLLESDATLAEVFALDVIGDPDASARNAEEMNRQGVPAIPTFHMGEDEALLFDMAKRYDKIALGGMARSATKMRHAFVGQCFARVWPKKIHGFAVSGERLVMAFPWHSVDATSWEVRPCKFGTWRAYNDTKYMSVRGSTQNLRIEVEWYLALERKARVRWRKEMRRLA